MPAFGLAGQAVVLIRQKQTSEAADKLTQLWPLRDKLDGEMRTLVQIVLSDRRCRAAAVRSSIWRDWFNSSPMPPPVSTQPTAANARVKNEPRSSRWVSC